MGGAINLQKSFWILMSWNLSNEKAPLSTPDTSVDKLPLTEGYQVESFLDVPQISPYTTNRTLGVYISPSGSPFPASRVLKDMAEAYTTQIRGCQLNREAALCLYLFQKSASNYPPSV
jgi:hypothetical protein